MYTKPFPKVDYYFGDAETPVKFKQLNAYVDLLDKVKHEVGFYRKHYIGTNERPDTLSYKLYGTPEYHWTFFLVNDSLRESGWPFPEFLGYEVAKSKFPNTTFTTTDLDTLFTKFQIGDTVKFASGDARKIIKRDLDHGQVTVEGPITPDNSGKVAVIDGTIDTIKFDRQVSEELSVHHYEDADGNWVDIDPRAELPEGLIPVTQYANLTQYNEQLRTINVIKESAIIGVVTEYVRNFV